jgi:hypothetical protein
MPRDATALQWLETDNLADRTRTFFDAKAERRRDVRWHRPFQVAHHYHLPILRAGT